MAYMDLVDCHRGGGTHGPVGVSLRAREKSCTCSVATAGLPYWFLFSLVCFVPGITLVRRFALNGWWALPCTAVSIEIAIGAVRHWPPTSWGPAEISYIGPTPPPINYWYFYLYSLWPDAFMALVSALILLLARHLFRPKIHEGEAAIDLTTRQPN
jgi:hypothetical protein